MHLVRLSVLLTALIVLAACATEPGGERPVFGESVRHMIEVQTYAPGDDGPPQRGTRAARAMEAYRQDASDPRNFGKGEIADE